MDKQNLKKMNLILGRRIKLGRELLGLTQEQLVDETMCDFNTIVGVSEVSSIKRYEKGLLPADKLIKIAQFFKVPAPYLIRDDRYSDEDFIEHFLWANGKSKNGADINKEPQVQYSLNMFLEGYWAADITADEKKFKAALIIGRLVSTFHKKLFVRNLDLTIKKNTPKFIPVLLKEVLEKLLCHKGYNPDEYMSINNILSNGLEPDSIQRVALLFGSIDSHGIDISFPNECFWNLNIYFNDLSFTSIQLIPENEIFFERV